MGTIEGKALPAFSVAAEGVACLENEEWQMTERAEEGRPEQGRLKTRVPFRGERFGLSIDPWPSAQR
jgi:hypothetical protein